MSNARPGSLHLCCRASLEDPRSVPGKPRSFVFDAFVFSSTPVNGSCMVPCSLRYYKNDENAAIPEGIYDIFATVCVYLFSLS